MRTRYGCLLFLGLLLASRVDAVVHGQEPGPTLNYVIGPGDRLHITVWNQDNVSGEYAVGGDGSFTFPLIGRVMASGLTLGGLEAALKTRLEDGYFRNPQLTIAVIEYRSKRVFVMGAVHLPATYPLTGEMRLIEALARAGSTTADAADHAFIIHSSGAVGPVLPTEAAAAEMMEVDLRRLNDGDRSIDVVLRDGDTVFVPRAPMVFVSGQVVRPGSYPIGAGTTVRQVISLAGGLTEYGAGNRIKVLRTVTGKQKEVRVDLNDAVQPDDTLVVPERMF
jgi:polysaccharide export outer membrane protein